MTPQDLIEQAHSEFRLTLTGKLEGFPVVTLVALNGYAEPFDYQVKANCLIPVNEQIAAIPSTNHFLKDALSSTVKDLLLNGVPRTAPQMLQGAADIMNERSETYDQPTGERSMGRTVDAFNIVSGRKGTGKELSEADGWLLMQLLKDVRQWSRDAYHKDSADDGIAYSALKAEALERASGDNEMDGTPHV